MRLHDVSWGAIALGLLGSAGCQSAMDASCLGSAEEQQLAGRVQISTGLPAPPVDILFVMDNSVSMISKQQQVLNTLPKFIQQLDTLPISYHIGVTTTDVGSLPAPGASFSTPPARCNTFAGDDGKLQNDSCRSRTGSADFSAACASLCPGSTGLPSQRYISKENGVLNVPDAATALQCMALVGDSGCGLEAPLEASKRALDGHLAENSGFLRPDSLLVVIYVTDEDDCSIQLSQRSKADPAIMDCATTNADSPYSCYNTDFRCMAKSIECNEPLGQSGPKTGCKERTDSWLEPLDTYHQFFSNLRKTGRLMFGTFVSPSILDFNAGKSTPNGNGQLIVAADGGSGTTMLNRGRNAQAACFNSALNYDGQAQIRMAAFKNKFDSFQIGGTSICAPDSFESIMTLLASKIERRSPYSCLPSKPTLTDQGDAVCKVGLVDKNGTASAADSCLPQCSSNCCLAWSNAVPPSNDDADIKAACAPEPSDCYCVVASNTGACDATAVAGLWRKDNAPLPAGQSAVFNCQ